MTIEYVGRERKRVLKGGKRGGEKKKKEGQASINQEQVRKDREIKILLFIRKRKIKKHYLCNS